MRRAFWTASVLACGLTGVAFADEIAPADLFSQLDKNQDGKLVADEIPEGQYKFFERVLRMGDKNQDGSITVEELTIALKQAPKTENEPRDEKRAGGPMRERIDPEAMFKRLDRNGDSKVSRDELPEGAQERLGPLFDKLGTDSISLEQFRNFAPREGRPGDGGRPPMDKEGMNRAGAGPEEGMRRGPRVPAFIKMADEDGNGTLNEAELANVSKFFKQLDKNGDGELDAVEVIGFPGPGPGQGPGRGDFSLMGEPGGRDRGPGAKGPGDRGPGDRGPGDKGPGERGPQEGKQGNRGPGAGKPEPGQLFAKMDADGDGFVSKEEAPERMRENFNKLDSNSDGKLSKDEIRSGLENMRRQNQSKPE